MIQDFFLGPEKMDISYKMMPKHSKGLNHDT